MGIGRAGFYTHDWVERLMFHAGYVEGRHSATSIHPELPPLAVGDTVPMGAGAFATVSEVEPYRHLVAQEAYVLRALPGNKTRLIARYRGMGFVSPHTPLLVLMTYLHARNLRRSRICPNWSAATCATPG